MKHPDTDKTQYHLDDNGEFIITDYNSAKPFSSFFPGIAGINGIPMWVFYVNRGQCICSMGVQDKDHPIMEFLPANRAYNLVATDGFRTFIKLHGDSPVAYYEPFQEHFQDRQLQRRQRMIIAPSHLTLEETNDSLGLKFTVEYFTVPQDNYAGLVRTLHIENIGSREIALEGLDGLPIIVPYGVDNFCLKNMRRTIEAFVEVSNFDNKVPFFRGKVEPDDRPDVRKITRGNFYLGFEPDRSDAAPVAPIVDPNRIFGSRTDHSYPVNFLEMKPEDLPRDQMLENQIPSAMGMFHTSLPAGKRYTYSSIIGHASSLEDLNEMVPRIATGDYIAERSQTNQDIIATLTQHNLISSSEPALDHYARQNFLDNAMRGGFPFTVSGTKDRSTLYLYSRKHGDLERDYNDFRLMPTPYSQGNGNFRDINQNRRSDLFFNPDIGAENVEYFYNLIQLDGFNPLVLKEMRFTAHDIDKVREILRKFLADDSLSTIESRMRESFTPGELLSFMDENHVELTADSESFIGELLNCCDKVPDIDYGESYWIDHWTYNLDLLENYLDVYPDRFAELMFGTNKFSFFDNPHLVQPRTEKYVLWEDKPMQLGAVLLDEDKAAVIESRERHRNQVRKEHGKGDIYRTTLFTKMLCLIVNKLASLDPDGIGVEMEAGKPGWYDALNGLPGLFGSSVCETLEIKRHLQFLLSSLNNYAAAGESIAVFEELNEFMDAVHDLLRREASPAEFWEAASTARESYRANTKMGVSGNQTPVEPDRIREFFEAALRKLDDSIEKARDSESNTLFTYFRYEVTDYEIIKIKDSAGNAAPKRNADGLTCIRPLKFKRVPLPLFLEGPVHYLRCLNDGEPAREFAASVRKSSLYDDKLKMYKVNASLADQPMEIGRARVFSPGWLENESIWLHMEYKYLLELLRNELYDDFYRDFRNVCIPFLSADMYGRSILENCSFLASSAHADSSIHGNGYVARLSGATAEFIHILLLMMVGPRPFRLSSNGELQLRLRPSLPGWLFSRKTRTVSVFNENGRREIDFPANTFGFMFLGDIPVTYHNSGLNDTFGDNAVKPVEWSILDSDAKSHTFQGETLSGDIVNSIRDRNVSKIDITLA